MEYQDRFLKCTDCGAEFVFTAGEQAFYADKGFRNEPKRCKPCKNKRAENTGHGSGAPRERNPDVLLPVREGNYGSLQADPGASRVLPRVFSAAADRGSAGLSPETAGRHRKRPW